MVEHTMPETTASSCAVQLAGCSMHGLWVKNTRAHVMEMYSWKRRLWIHKKKKWSAKRTVRFLLSAVDSKACIYAGARARSNAGRRGCGPGRALSVCKFNIVPMEKCYDYSDAIKWMRDAMFTTSALAASHTQLMSILNVCINVNANVLQHNNNVSNWMQRKWQTNNNF